MVQYVVSHFSWYDEHLKECDGGNDDDLRIRVVLLTNDRENREKAKKEGIISYTGNIHQILLINLTSRLRRMMMIMTMTLMMTMAKSMAMAMAMIITMIRTLDFFQVMFFLA